MNELPAPYGPTHAHHFVANPGSFPFCERCGAMVFMINPPDDSAPRVLVVKPEAA